MYAWALLAVGLLSGCESTPSSRQRTSASAPAPTAPARKRVPTPPTILGKVVTTDAGEELSTLATLAVNRLTTKDALRVVIRWEDRSSGELRYEHKIGKQKVDWPKTYESMQLHVRHTDGTARTFDVDASSAKPRQAILAAQSSVFLRFDRTGMFSEWERYGWENAKADIFATTGSYNVKVTGTLFLDNVTIPFATGDLAVGVAKASSSFKTISELEAAAAAHVARAWSLDKPPSPTKATVADFAGNRLVRFSLDAESYNDVDFVEVVIDTRGTVQSMSSTTIFVCIAEGTLIHTPSGKVPVQNLRRGDTVWGYDPDSQSRVTTEVTSVYRSDARALLEIAPGLQVTPTHPVFANGGWVAAHALKPDDMLLTFGLERLRLAVQPVHRGASSVFDISVGWPHTFFAGEILVHNKTVGTREGRFTRTDDWYGLWFRPKSR
jgi:hypothetical protein